MAKKPAQQSAPIMQQGYRWQFTYDNYVFGRHLAQMIGAMAARDERGNGLAQYTLYQYENPNAPLHASHPFVSRVQVVRKGPRHGRALGWPKDDDAALTTRPYLEIYDADSRHGFPMMIGYAVYRDTPKGREVLLSEKFVAVHELVQVAISVYQALSAD